MFRMASLLAPLIVASGWPGVRAQDAPPGEAPGLPSATAWTLAFPKREHDFGRIPAGDRVRHVFPITNAGPEPLAIAAIQASCSCVELGDWTAQLAPGATGAIPVLFHTANYSGPVMETLTVVGADPSAHPVTLSLRADAWRPIEVQPASATFEWYPNDPEASVGTVRLINRGEIPLELSTPVSRHPGLSGELIPVIPGHEFELRVRRVPPLQKGHLYGSLTLRTSLDSMPLLEVPVHSLAPAAVSTTPRSLVFPAGLAADASRAVVVRFNGEGTLRLRQPVPPLPGARVVLKEIVPGKKFLVTVDLPAGLAGAVPQGTTLILEPDPPQPPKLQIPLRNETPAEQQRRINAPTAVNPPDR